jgi:hypothetical protein
MPVKNVECQIAEMQIGRYVSGEPFSGEALRQLEAHLSTCPACTAVLSDRRTALQSMLKQGFAAVTTDSPTQRKENLLLRTLREKATAAESDAPRPQAAVALMSDQETRSRFSWLGTAREGKPPISKSLIYSGLLATVLVAMSFFSKSQSTLFGGSADKSFPDATPAAARPHLTTKTPPKTQTPAPAGAILKSTPQEPAPITAKARTTTTKEDTPPLPEERKPRYAPASRPHKRTRPAAIAHFRKLARPVRSTVRIYDESGAPLGR